MTHKPIPTTRHSDASSGTRHVSAAITPPARRAPSPKAPLPTSNSSRLSSHASTTVVRDRREKTLAHSKRQTPGSTLCCHTHASPPKRGPLPPPPRETPHLRTCCRRPGPPPHPPPSSSPPWPQARAHRPARQRAPKLGSTRATSRAQISWYAQGRCGWRLC
jgi:hypothetical protein